jgi:hypothetical protein
MELRKHPRMRYRGRPNWPPQWNVTYGPSKPVPAGEVGILTKVESLSTTPGAPHCILVMQWNGQEYLASLCFDDEQFLHEVVELLRGCLGRPIAEIGSLDIPG